MRGIKYENRFMTRFVWVVVEASTSQALLDLAFPHNLTQIVKEGTRTQDSVSSIIDLVFLSKALAQTGYSHEVLDGISDHDMIIVPCPLRRRDTTRVPKASFSDFSMADDNRILDLLDANYDSFREFFLIRHIVHRRYLGKV